MEIFYILFVIVVYIHQNSLAIHLKFVHFIYGKVSTTELVKLKRGNMGFSIIYPNIGFKGRRIYKMTGYW